MGLHLIDPDEFDRIVAHSDHDVRIGWYGGGPDDIQNVAIECRDCATVLHDVEPDPEVGD